MRAVIAIVCACALGACAKGGVPGNNGGDDVPPPLDSPGAPVCGDGVCASVEIGTCTADCGMPPPAAVCPNGKCEPPTENNANCAQDCPTSSNCNHNTVCDANETTADCADDCPPPPASPCPMFPPFPPSSCKDCATGDQVACAILGKTMADCQMCVVSGCAGQMANASCDFPETPFTCVDCFQ